MVAEFIHLAGNVGFICHGTTMLDWDLKCKADVQKLVLQNPIYSKQVELARKQVARNTTIDKYGREQIDEIPPERQFSVRETSSEAAFNRIILLTSRDVSWKSFSTQRSPRDQSTNAIKAKQGRNRLLIRNTVRFVKNELRKMMEE